MISLKRLLLLACITGCSQAYSMQSLLQKNGAVGKTFASALTCNNTIMRMTHNKQSTVQKKAAHNHGQDQSQDSHSFNRSFMPAGALAASIALSQQTLEEEQVDQQEIDICNTQAVLALFMNGSYEEQNSLAQRIAQEICNNTQINVFALLKEYPQELQALILTHLESNYNFNKGDMVAVMRDYLKQQRDLAYQKISEEWGLSADDWQAIRKEVDAIKVRSACAKPVGDQFIYEMELSAEIKELLAEIYQARGISGRVKVKKLLSYEDHLSAAASGTITDFSYVYNLELNEPWLKQADFDEIRFVLEHEIGGHIRFNHGLIASVIVDYIKRYKRRLISRVKRSTSWQFLERLDEYEADLASAIEDQEVAYIIKKDLDQALLQSSERPHKGLYMSFGQFHREIAAIIALKEAARKWFDGSEAYHLYGPPAYDAFDYSKQ